MNQGVPKVKLSTRRCEANEIFSQRTFLTATTQTLFKLARFDKLYLMVLVPELCIESLLLEKPVPL